MKRIISNLLIVVLLMGTVLGCLSACTDANVKNDSADNITTTAPIVNDESESESTQIDEPEPHIDYAASV